MLRIGDFSRLGQVTVRTLRLYDEMGLLKPAHVDDATGYRYYSSGQLSRLNRILVLKDMGFSLEQIACLLQSNLSADQLRSMFMMKQAELERDVHEKKMRLGRVETRLRQIEQEGQLPKYEVILKSIDLQTIISASQVVPARSDIPYYRQALFGLVYGWLKQAQIESPGPELTVYQNIYHSIEYVEQEIGVEAAVVIDPCALKSSTLPAANGNVTIRELPAVQTAASVIHQGDPLDTDQAITALCSWIEARGWSVIGPRREIYLSGSELESKDNKSITVEIQLPIEKWRREAFTYTRW